MPQTSGNDGEPYFPTPVAKPSIRRGRADVSPFVGSRRFGFYETGTCAAKRQEKRPNRWISSAPWYWLSSPPSLGHRPGFADRRRGLHRRVRAARNTNDGDLRFDRIARKAGISTTRLHDLRHAAATSLLLAGDVRTSAGVLGYASPTITLSTYAHLMPEAQREAVDRPGERLERLAAAGFDAAWQPRHDKYK